MKVIVLEYQDEDLAEQVQDARAKGFIVFILHELDPENQLVPQKFLHYRTDAELFEKLNLLKADITIEDVLRW